MRGEDCLGRFSGNKFGIILKNCSPDDIMIAAERFLAGVRDDVVTTTVGPVAVTSTIGGVTAPRHAGNIQEILARAQETLDTLGQRPVRFAYRPCRARGCAGKPFVPREIVTALQAPHHDGLRAGVEDRTREHASMNAYAHPARDGTINRKGKCRLRELGLCVGSITVCGTAVCRTCGARSEGSIMCRRHQDIRLWARLGACSAHREVGERLTVEN